MSRSNKSNSTTHTKPSRTAKTAKTSKSTKATKTITPAPMYVDEPPTTSQSPCYIPLCLGSQSGHSHVLYYNANAPIDEIFDCAIARLQAVIDLMESLFEYSTAEKTAIPAIATVAAYLLNDAMTLLQELSPLATQLRAKTGF